MFRPGSAQCRLRFRAFGNEEGQKTVRGTVFPTNAPEGAPLRFTSAILPPYLRRAKSIEELLPWLYLKGEEDQKTIRGIVFPTQAPAIFPRRWRPCWDRMHRDCRPAPSPG